MRYIGLAAFGATVCVLVPLTQLGAGPNERAKLYAPDTHELVVDGIAVTATLEQPFVDEGAATHLTLTADKEIQVGIVVVGSSGTEGSRVPNPPRPVMHETVTLTPNKTGKATKDVTLHLSNALAEGDSELATYKLYITSRETGERLQRLVDRAGPSIPTGEIPDMDTDTMKLLGTLSRASESQQDDQRDDNGKLLFAKGSVAVLEAYQRPVSDSIAIAAPNHADVGQAFDVKVTVRNPTNQTLEHQEISLEVMAIGDAYAGASGSDVKIDPVDAVTLAPHQHKTVTFKVTAPIVGVMGLRASMPSNDYSNVARELHRGTFEAVEIVTPSSERSDHEVAKK
jgi:hypothetical protein